MSHSAASPVALPAGPSIPAIVSCAVKMGGAIAARQALWECNASPSQLGHRYELHLLNSHHYPPDCDGGNRGAPTLDMAVILLPLGGLHDQSCSLGILNSDVALDEGDPFKPMNLFFLSLLLALPELMLLGLTPCLGPLQDLAVSGPMRSS